MFRRIVTAVFTLAFAALLLVLVWPQLFGLQREPVVAHIVAFRGIALAVAVAVIVLLTLMGLLSTRLRRFVATIAILLIAFSLVTFGVLAMRGFGNPSVPTKANGELTVLSWNTLGDAPGAQAIAQLILEQDADIVVLPETSVATATEVQNLLVANNRRFQRLELSFDQISKARTTSLLIADRLGEYVRDDSVGSTTTLPSVVAVPVDGTGPTIIAAHPVAPVPGEMDNWRASLSWLSDQCDASNVILAGDLNSTLDHLDGLGIDGGQLGRCLDGARATNNAAVGTWPTFLPTFLATPIDHVMATDGWQFMGFRVIGSVDGSGSDHRPVMALLRPLK